MNCDSDIQFGIEKFLCQRERGHKDHHEHKSRRVGSNQGFHIFWWDVKREVTK